MSNETANKGIDRRGALECMIWAGTGVIWTLSGGVPKSSQLLGVEPAQAAGKTIEIGLAVALVNEIVLARHVMNIELDFADDLFRIVKLPGL